MTPLLSIDEFFSKSIIVKNCSYIDEEHRFLLLKEATNIKNFSKLGISNNFNDFIKQSEYLFRFFTELSCENISFDSIKKADTYEFYEEHLSLLEKIYANYCSLLEENNYVDKITLPNKYELNLDYLHKFDRIVLFFEGYLTHFEFNLITKISKIIPLEIHLQTNIYNKKSYEKFIEYGLDLDSNTNYILDISKKSVIESIKIDYKSPSLSLKGFSARINQIAFIKDAVASMINKGFKPEEIVLIVPDESFIEILELFDQEEYFNYAMGKDITTSKLYSKAYALYQYINDFEKKDIDYVNFLNFNTDAIIQSFDSSWNKQVTLDIFNELVLYIKSDEENDEILEKYEEECYKLKNLIFNYKESITLKEAYKFLLQRISALTIDDVNSGVITVMGLLETRGINYKGVIIVDFNEEIVPKKSIKDKFLSTNIKKYSNLPTRKDRENLQKYYYHKLCKNAQELHVSFVKNDTHSISRFAKELFNTSEVKEISDNLYKNILYTTNTLKHFDENITLNIDLSLQAWSATSLKIYLQCKRKYYLQYIANIKDHHFSLKPQNFEIGTAIHSILEKFYKANKRVDDTIKDNVLNEYFQELKQENPFMILDLEIWKKKLESFIQNEKKEFASKSKEVYKTEMPFKITYHNISLKGVIDRIDKGKDFFEIIDYKTSTNLTIDTDKTYEKSVDFQLEFYFLAMKEYLKTIDATNFAIKPYYYNLNNASLLEESVLEEKLKLLEEILLSLKTTSVSFEKCDDKSLCSYCSYSTICNR